jgi:cytochrome c-type biogenesis protein CcmH
MQTFNEIATYSGIFSAAIRSPLPEGASNGLLIRDDSLLARESCCCLRLAVRRGPKAIFRDTLKVLTGLFVLIWISIGQVSFVSAGALLQDLENALMCKCDDKCGKVLMNCTCSTADKTRANFSKMLESGLTVEQIIKMQVDEYGETVLSAPTKFGFNLTAWLTPFVALVAGGFGVRKFLLACMGKKDGSDSKKVSVPEPEIPEKYSKRLKDELDGIEL